MVIDCYGSFPKLLMEPEGEPPNMCVDPPADTETDASIQLRRRSNPGALKGFVCNIVSKKYLKSKREEVVAVVMDE